MSFLAISSAAAATLIGLRMYKKHKVKVVQEKVARLMEYELNPLIINHLRKENPKWTDKQVNNAIIGFKEFMSLFITSPGKNLGMTSVGIDEVWHAFLRYETLYKNFCMEFIGYVVEHKENGSTPGIITKKSRLNRDVIETKNAINHSKKKYGTQFTAGDGSPATGFDMPMIFSYDLSNNIPGGWYYEPDVYQKIDVSSAGTSSYSTTSSIDSGSSAFHTSDSVGSSCSTSSSGSSCSSSSGSSCSSGGD